jgi:hypothetical protein
MPLRELESLVRIGKLKVEPPEASEFVGLLHSAEARLRDAQNETLSPESRFDLAYNASHAFCLAALRWHGYRSDDRYIVFQVLPHTLKMKAEQWRVLDQAHRRRNRLEYEGVVEVDSQILAAMIRVAQEVRDRVRALSPIV